MRVGKGLQTQGAVVQVLRVRLLVVQERPGVAVGAAAQVTPAARCQLLLSNIAASGPPITQPSTTTEASQGRDSLIFQPGRSNNKTLLQVRQQTQEPDYNHPIHRLARLTRRLTAHNVNSHEALVSSVRLLGPGPCGVLPYVAAVPLQTGPALEPLPTVGTAQVSRGPIVDPLVVVQDAGEAEGFAAREAHVLLPLRVDARVIPQSHGVGEGLGAEGAAEVARLVGVFVVQKRAGVPVAAVANVARERPLLFARTGICWCLTAA